MYRGEYPVAEFKPPSRCSRVSQRPHSDSAYLDNHYSILPSIPRGPSLNGALPWRQNALKERLTSDLLDRLIDEVLTEEIIPDILVDVLLYGTKTIHLPSTQERVIEEYLLLLIDEFLLSELRYVTQSTLSDFLDIYRKRRYDGNLDVELNLIIDELISVQIRDTVSQFCSDYVEMYLFCSDEFNNMIKKLLHEVIAEEEEVPDEKSSRDTFSPVVAQLHGIDDQILGAVLCRSLINSNDPISNSIIASGIVLSLRK